MIIQNTEPFLHQTTVLYDQVGADGTTILAVILAHFVREGIPVYLVSAVETLQRFKMLLRKLNAPDLTLLEAQGKFKFSATTPDLIDTKYFVFVHGCSFMPLHTVCLLAERPNTLLHLHKDIDVQLGKYLTGKCNLVMDMTPLASGFSQQIFCRLALYPGGAYNSVVKEVQRYTVTANSDTAVTLAHA